MKPYFMIVGPSGSGKTTLCRQLCKDLGLHQTPSCTTRDKRPSDDNTDEPIRFCSTKGFLSMTFAEWVEYNGNYYGTEVSDIAATDIKVITPDGCSKLRSYLEGLGRPCYVIGLWCPEVVCIGRMVSRGDTFTYANNRAVADSEKFSSEGVGTHMFIPNFSMEEHYAEVRYFVEERLHAK